MEQAETWRCPVFDMNQRLRVEGKRTHTQTECMICFLDLSVTGIRNKDRAQVHVSFDLRLGLLFPLLPSLAAADKDEYDLAV